MLTIFMIDGLSENIYITTPEEYSKVLANLGVNPDKVTYQNITLERLILVSDRVTGYIVVNLIK